MADHVIEMTKDPAGKIVPATPDKKVVVDLGQTITWTSTESDLEITFRRDHPFTNGNVFHVGDTAEVRRDEKLRGQHFACKVTLGGETQDNVTGVDIQPRE